MLNDSETALLIESDDRVVYSNPAYASLLGYRSPQDLLGTPVPDLTFSEDSDRLLFYSRCREKGMPAPARYFFRGRKQDGSPLHLEATVWLTRSDGLFLITTIARQVTTTAPWPLWRDPIPGLEQLSHREHEVLSFILRGVRSTEVALKLGISEKTVGTYKKRIFDKFSVRTDFELFLVGVRCGLIDTGAATAAPAAR